MSEATATPVAAVLDVAREVMGEPTPRTGPLDAGPAVLAGVLASLGVTGADRFVAGWLTQYQGAIRHSGLADGGLAGLASGARTAIPAWPRMAGPAARAGRRLISNVPTGEPFERVEWRHYDLVHGATGIALTLAAAPDRQVDHVLPVATWLAGMCGSDDLSGARVTEYTDDPVRGWNTGLVNLGVAHGVAGIAAALLACLEVTGPREDLAASLRRIVRFLRHESYPDEGGVRIWPPGSRGGDPPTAGATGPLGWCYGTPGVAWVLWEAGRVLADPEVRRFAADAMESLCRAWLASDDDIQVAAGPAEESLAFCHGLAGVLLIAGAFDQYAGLPAAAALRARVRDLLLARMDEVRELAERDVSLITGASGVLSALLADLGGERSWLRTYALR